uniref:NADH dehydrogenase subunit 6 n=1 Tax=Euwallacea interjectus TaxID=321055 RepID=UPI0022A76A6F|nr:NADH dehydrogenase subunit 6 [Euwallacea interjectus]UZT26983.1 NADH dehydrogenase subunit 6 [Euwallacea interjectus]
MLLTLVFLNCLLSTLFIFLKNPLSKGYILLMMTISISLFSSQMYLNSWFGYILFLIMVGGILVAFIYMTSVASNEKFKFPKTFNMLMFMSIFLIVIMASMKLTIETLDLSMVMTSQELVSNNKMSLSKIFSNPMSLIPLALMSYLLLTLILVVKMTDLSKGPIRQK